LVLAACPEVGKSFPIEPVKGYGIGAHGSKEAELAEALQLGRVKSLVELPLASLAREEGREVWEHDRKCACGRRSYVFARCVSCIEKEAADDLRAGAEFREMKEENEEPEGELVVEELLTFTSAPKGQSEPKGCFVHSLLVRKWAGAWMSSGNRMDSTPYHADTEVSRCGYGRRAKDSNCLVKVQGARKSMGSLGVHSLSDQSLDIVNMVHQCADVSKLKAVNPVWELSEVNWFNHLRLVVWPDFIE
jgi:hypothetical protein